MAVCSPREVEVKDHQLNNKPGGEIKEKTRRSSNCYPQTDKLKLQGVESLQLQLKTSEVLRDKQRLQGFPHI